MGWSIGYDEKWKRDIGYGVPATCDHPGCGEKIDRGLAYVCANEQPYGGDDGCGLYFCGRHLHYHDHGGFKCERCGDGKPPFEPTPDTPEWVNWKLTDESWQQWRDEHPDEVAAMNGRVRHDLDGAIPQADATLEANIRLCSADDADIELQQIHFPTPAPGWGVVTCYVMANKRWRWWSFWRPRVLYVPAPIPVKGQGTAL